MVQPFIADKRDYIAREWPEITCRYRLDHLLIESVSPLESVSSALWGGGATRARYFVNGKVQRDFVSAEPKEMMRHQINAWGYDEKETVGLLTAAKLWGASVAAEAGDQFRIICCATVGTANGARAGLHRETFSAYQLGTINLFVLIDGRLTPAAMINGVMTATEAKCAVLQDLGITEETGAIITGTTSDAIVLAASQNEARYHGIHAFAGTATTIGNAIGRLVYQVVHEAARTQGEDSI